MDKLLHGLRGLDVPQRQAGSLADHPVFGFQTLFQVDNRRDVISASPGQRNNGHSLDVDVFVCQKV